MPTRPERLRAAPGFVQAFAHDGRPFVLQDTEPYAQYWLGEPERRLLAVCGARGGLGEAAALDACARLAGRPRSAAGDRALRRTMAAMREAGVLVTADDDASRYDRRIVDAYVAHRPFPAPIAAAITGTAALGPGRRALDLAGGPGDLALACARTGAQTTLLELSRGFVDAARRRARAEGLPLQAEQENANRLPQRDDGFDLVTVSQALHWLDDVAVCRGVLRVLRPGGWFMVVHAVIDLPEANPLAYLLGPDSILGARPRRPFAQELAPLQQRLQRLLEALHAPGVDRHDPTRPGAGAAPVVPAGVLRFRQRRPFGPGYAQGFLTPRHIALTGQTPEAFWADLAARCRGLPARRFLGAMDWGVLMFRRGGAPVRRTAPLQRIGYDGPI